MVTKKLPSRRTSRSFSSRACQLWALEPSRSRIPANSDEIVDLPCLTRSTSWKEIHHVDAKSAGKATNAPALIDHLVRFVLSFTGSTFF